MFNIFLKRLLASRKIFPGMVALTSISHYNRFDDLIDNRMVAISYGIIPGTMSYIIQKRIPVIVRLKLSGNIFVFLCTYWYCRCNDYIKYSY